MSKGTDKLKDVMDRHDSNALACQSANTAKQDADAAFVKSAKDVDDAIATVEQEAKDLAEKSTKVFDKAQAPVPDQSNTSILDAPATPGAS